MKAITENGNKITLLDKHEIKRGGEGKILTIPELPQQVAKIYLNSNYQHMSKAQKDALSVLDDRFFVKPLELIYSNTQKKEILGFTMEYLPADFLPLSAFFSKNFCATHQIDYIKKIEIARQLTQAVAAAHQQQIVIGDLSGLNVMMNTQGKVKFLDVDAYETPVHSHWGLLLDEIRDYLYQGKVSQESDYFALGILIFSLFTHLHPFKGIHKQYKSMAERMVRKLPVFAQDPQLIIPKCYTPIQDRYLQQQFERIFLEGERFLLSVDKVVQAPVVPQPVATPIRINTPLKYQEMYQLQAGEMIRQAHFTATQGYIQTNQRVMLFDVSNQGYTRLKKTFLYPSVADAQAKYFVGNQHFFMLKAAQLFVWNEASATQFVPISNFEVSSEAQYALIGTILVVLDEGYMRYLHLDQVIGNQIHIEQTPVFTQGFDIFQGFIQHVGGVQYLYYASGHTLSTVRSTRLLKAVRIEGNVGWAVFEEQLHGETTLRYAYFSIQNLQIQWSGETFAAPIHFTYKAQNTQKGLLFEAHDDVLKVRSTDTFALVAELPCSLLTTETQLAATQAGIIAYEKDFCYLLNTA